MAAGSGLEDMLKSRAAIISAVLTGLFVIAALFLQSQIEINRDTALHLYLNKLGRSENYYLLNAFDRIHDTYLRSNLALYLIPAKLWQWQGGGGRFWLNAYVLGVFAFAFIHLLSFARHLAAQRPAVWFLLPSFTFAALVFPVDTFAQREHLVAMLITPWLLHAVDQAAGTGWRERISWPVSLALAAGLLIKPYYVLIWGSAELLRLVLTGNYRSLINRTTLLTVGSHAAYYGSLLYSLSQAGYGQDDLTFYWIINRFVYFVSPFGEFIFRKYSLLWVAAFCSVPLLLRGGRIGKAGTIFAVAWLAAIATVFIQFKNWDLYWYLPTALAGLLVGWAPLAAAETAPAFRKPAFFLALAAFCGFILLGGLRVAGYAPRLISSAETLGRISAAVEKHADGGRILVMSDDFHPLYETMVKTGLNNASSFRAFWVMGAVQSARQNPLLAARVADLRLPGVAQEVLGPSRRIEELPAGLDGVVEFMTLTAVADLERIPPALILMPAQGGGAMSPILDDPRFKKAIAGYSKVESVDGWDLLVRPR